MKKELISKEVVNEIFNSLEPIKTVPNPVEHDIKPYEPFKKIGLSTNEIPDILIEKAKELGIEKVIRIAGEIIDKLEKVMPIVEFVLSWFNITPKKEVTPDKRVKAVADAIDILTRLKK